MTAASSPPALSPEQGLYLGQRLSQVSRSFALVLPRIEKPLGDYLATAYLLCRVVDNVEDCGAPAGWRLARFAEVERMLADPGTAPEVLASWDRREWPGLSLHEEELMSHAGGAPLWRIYGSMPEDPRAHVRRWILAMVHGMRGLAVNAAGAWTDDGTTVRRPRLVEGYNDYCFVVAGTVGRMATELVVGHFELARDVADRLRGLSDACGRGLQKTNIVKDFAEDLARGVCYLPDEWLLQVGRAPIALRGAPVDWTRVVIGDVLTELRDATEYVRALPRWAAGYRMACLLCLLPAYATLLEAARRHESLFTAQHRVKISRAAMAVCLAEASAMVSSNSAILDYSQRAERSLVQALCA